MHAGLQSEVRAAARPARHPHATAPPRQWTERAPDRGRRTGPPSPTIHFVLSTAPGHVPCHSIRRASPHSSSDQYHTSTSKEPTTPRPAARTHQCLGVARPPASTKQQLSRTCPSPGRLSAKALGSVDKGADLLVILGAIGIRSLR